MFLLLGSVFFVVFVVLSLRTFFQFAFMGLSKKEWLFHYFINAVLALGACSMVGWIKLFIQEVTK